MSQARILIVEDELIIAMDIKTILQKLGYNACGVVNSGEDAIKEAVKLQPDLILMDIILNGSIDGIEAARNIYSLLKIPIIYMTANADKKTIERARDTAPFGYILKPFNENDLHSNIESALYKNSMEKRLRASEKKYRELVELLPQCIFEADLNGKIIFLNNIGLELYGYTPDDLEKGINFAELIHPDQIHEAVLNMKKVMDKKKSDRTEYIARKKSGQYFPVMIYSSFIAEDNKPVGIRGTVLDLREQKLTETEIKNQQEELHEVNKELKATIEELQATNEQFEVINQELVQKNLDLMNSEARYKTLFESSADAIFILEAKRDNSGKIVSANNTALNMYGYTKEELYEMHIEDLYDPESEKIALARMERLKPEEKLTFEVLHRRKDGSTILVEMKAKIIKLENRRYIFAINRDITEKKKIEDAFRRKIEWEDFITNLSIQFASYSADQVDKGIYSALKAMANFTGAEKSYITILSDNLKTWSVTHEWHADDIAGRFNDLQNVPKNTYFWCRRMLADNRAIKINKIDDFPAEAKTDRVLIENQGIRSLLYVPLHGRGMVKGSINLELFSGERTWSEEDVWLASMLGMLFVNAIERKNAEASLRKERDLNARLLETSPAGILMLDKTGKIMFANASAEQVLGLSFNDMIKLAYNSEYWHIANYNGSTFPNEKLPFDLVLTTGKPVNNVHHSIKKQDGQTALLTINASPLFNQSGAVEGVVATVEDITEQVRAADALRESEQKFRTIIEQTMEGFVLVDENGTVIEWNKAMESLSGINRDDIMGIPFQDIQTKIPQPDQQSPEWYEQIENAMLEANKTVQSSIFYKPIDIIIKNQGGRIIYAQQSIFPVKLGNGLRIGSIIRDITGLKAAEMALRDSEELYRTLVETSPDGIILLDLKGKPLALNKKLALMHGYNSVEEILSSGLTITDFIVHSDKKRAIKNAIKTIRIGQFISAEYLAVHRDKSTFPIEINSSVIHDKDGAPLGYVIVSRDITERKRAEESLREGEERFSRLVEAAFEGIAIHENMMLIDFNEQFANMLGYTTSEITGRNILDFVSPESRETVRKHINEKSEVPYEHFALKKNGMRLPVEVRGRSLPYKGRIVRVTTVRDITEQKHAEEEKKRLEEQLRQAQKMESIGRLAGGIAHDFNNLLTAITGNITLALMDIPPTDRLHETLIEIQKAAESASSLTHQLLAFSRKQIIEPKIINIDDLIQNMKNMIQRLIGENIELKTNKSKNLGNIKMDPAQFEQILVNLSVNARDAMPDGGTLIIETADIELDENYIRFHPYVEAGNYIMLSVSDTGHGMSNDAKSHIFEPFFTTKSFGKGTGLGLATTYGVVKQNGGSIEVYSEANMGTTFKIFLPRTESTVKEALSVTKKHSQFPGGSETIMLVEDEPSVRGLVEKLLKRFGYDVLSYTNASEAILAEKSYKGRINLLITDIVMPGINGHELARDFLKKRPGIKILLTSGYTEDVIIQHGIFGNELNFISKPYKPDALAVKIREILDDK